MRIRMPVYSKGSIVNGIVNYQRAAARRRVAEHPREGICVGFFFSRIFLPGQLFALIAEHPLEGRGARNRFWREIFSTRIFSGLGMGSRLVSRGLSHV